MNRPALRRTGVRTLALAALLGAATAADAPAQQRWAQHYAGGAFNWEFLRRYPEAARLFNAFDYGHAVLYEHLILRPRAPVAALERDAYAFIVDDLLRRPPRLPVAEDAIEPTYARLAPRAKRMFDWAHVLHRQLYDVYATPGLDSVTRAGLVERLTDHYLANGRDAFTPVPKAMALMDEQAFSQVFRQGWPRFNGLIWAYHWLQVGLYDAFLAANDTAEARRLVRDVVGRFRAMVDAPPGTPADRGGLPSVMPMTPAVAPRFAAAHPRAAAIFDNLHMMHDIISDILADARIPRAEKGRAIEAQLARFRDPTADLEDEDHWRMMAAHMGGVGRMGGEAVPR